LPSSFSARPLPPSCGDDSISAAAHRVDELAEKRGVGYQTIIKTLLHDALKKESKIA